MYVASILPIGLKRKVKGKRIQCLFRIVDLARDVFYYIPTPVI